MINRDWDNNKPLSPLSPVHESYCLLLLCTPHSFLHCPWLAGCPPGLPLPTPRASCSSCPATGLPACQLRRNGLSLPPPPMHPPSVPRFACAPCYKAGHGEQPEPPRPSSPLSLSSTSYPQIDPPSSASWPRRPPVGLEAGKLLLLHRRMDEECYTLYKPQRARRRTASSASSPLRLPPLPPTAGLARALPPSLSQPEGRRCCSLAGWCGW